MPPSAPVSPILAIERDGFEVETEFTIRSTKGGLLVCEVPSYELIREYGQSNLRVVRDGFGSRAFSYPSIPGRASTARSSETLSLIKANGDGPVRRAA